MAFYLGRRRQGDLILFRSDQPPTKESHGQRFVAVIGTFKSKVGAIYFARYGRDDPRIRTADDAERPRTQQHQTDANHQPLKGHARHPSLRRSAN